MLAEKQIICQVCGIEFAFTPEEQTFYQEKGFQEPKKCKPCRDSAKQAKRSMGGGGYGGGGGGGRGGYRQLFDVICSGCGVQTQVPFQPNGSKPVYCRTCYQSQQGNYYSGGSNY